MNRTGGAGVVVVALIGGEALERCLQALHGVHDRCVVVLGDDMGVAQAWATRFPGVRFVDAGGLPVPSRRQRGIDIAGDEIVALIEDTSVPDPGWYEALCQAFDREDVGAVGGPVRVAASLPDRFQALACGEYGQFHPRRFVELGIASALPDGRQAVARLPGNNIAYRRAEVVAWLSQTDRGLIESEINQALLARGRTLLIQPRMAVTYAAADCRNVRLGARLQHGRLFASSRVRGEGWFTRLAWFAKSLLLPLVLSARAWRSMTRVVRPAAWLGVAAWILVLETAWAAGEAIGYLTGRGRSLEAWH